MYFDNVGEYFRVEATVTVECVCWCAVVVVDSQESSEPECTLDTEVDASLKEENAEDEEEEDTPEKKPPLRYHT